MISSTTPLLIDASMIQGTGIAIGCFSFCHSAIYGLVLTSKKIEKWSTNFQQPWQQTALTIIITISVLFMAIAHAASFFHLQAVISWHFSLIGYSIMGTAGAQLGVTIGAMTTTALIACLLDLIVKTHQAQQAN